MDPALKPQRGKILAEGKTEIVHEDQSDPARVILFAKDDITAGDGKKHDVIEGKAALATRTTCNVFRLLKSCGIPVAFNEQIDDRSFSSPKARMIPLEVVARREAHGSFLVRYPQLPKGTLFPRLVFELFLKTKDRTWKELELPCDDPHAIFVPERNSFDLYDVKRTFAGQAPFASVPAFEVFENLAHEPRAIAQVQLRKHLRTIEDLTRKTFLILEKAWQLQGRRLVDFKIEFAFANGKIVVADVIDNDSWRVLEAGSYIDKQIYREGGTLSVVAEKYAHVARLTDGFVLPEQSIVLWAGSEKDDLGPFKDALNKFEPLVGVSVVSSVISAHKQPIKAAQAMRQLAHERPDMVVIAYIGRSNGAGPTLSAQASVPVITVPAGWKDCPEDVWSSLRGPSEVPVMTVLEPGNAVLAALNILAARSPSIYAALHLKLEERAENIVPFLQ